MILRFFQSNFQHFSFLHKLDELYTKNLSNCIRYDQSISQIFFTSGNMLTSVKSWFFWRVFEDWSNCGTLRSWFSLSSALQKGWKIVTFKSLCPSLDTSENCARPSIISFFDARYFYDLHSPNPHSMNFSQVTLEMKQKVEIKFSKNLFQNISLTVKFIMNNSRKNSPLIAKKCQISNLRSIWQLATLICICLHFCWEISCVSLSQWECDRRVGI